MKHILMITLLLQCVFTVCPTTTFALSINESFPLANEPDKLKADSIESSSLKIESDFNNKYLWRGIEFQDAITWNPNVTYVNKNFSTNLWTNIPVHYYNIEDKSVQDFKEIDINVNYEIEKEVSYTMISHSAQVFTPFGKSEWYWGMVNVFQGFYKRDIGVYINPEINYYPFKGGLFYETGLNYNHENKKSEIEIYLAYSNSNKIFTQYNICNGEDNTYYKPFQTIKFDVSYQCNIKSVFIRPHFSYFHLLNYADVLGYSNNFSFGIGIGLQKN